MNHFVYILASKRNGTLYIGVTNDLARDTASKFTLKHSVNKLVHAEVLTSPQDAIQRETNLKKWPQEWKLDLIEQNNPDWIDLYEILV